jgi:hypothetical protein
MFHRWLSADEGMASCLTCGGRWTDHDGGYGGVMCAIDGESAVSCTGNTDQCHHYSDECYADECKLDPECNCLLCHS